jgi:hypothetical protein
MPCGTHIDIQSNKVNAIPDNDLTNNNRIFESANCAESIILPIMSKIIIAAQANTLRSELNSANLRENRPVIAIARQHPIAIESIRVSVKNVGSTVPGITLPTIHRQMGAVKIKNHPARHDHTHPRVATNSGQIR